jgi:hypothetical protein
MEPLISWAKQLGKQDCVSLLQQTLDEKKATDKKLTRMAENAHPVARAIDLPSEVLPTPADETGSGPVTCW